MQMRQSAATIITVIATLSCAQTPAPQTSYFPPHTLSQNMPSDKFVTGWYSQQLAALKEPSLWRPIHETNDEEYRFLWLRTFHHPIAVRLAISPSGEGTLITKIADGAGGYKPGKLITDTTTHLDKVQLDRFREKIIHDNFWNLPAEGTQGGMDGSEWIIEGQRHGNYHVVSRWTPSSGEVFDLGNALAIEMAKIDIPKSEFY